MAVELDNKLVIGISSRALFDLAEAHSVFETRGLDAYIQYQKEREEQPLNAGTAFPLVKALLGINKKLGEHVVEVVIISSNDGDSGLRIWKSIHASGLNIIRGSFSGGAHGHKYVHAYSCKLFLSADEEDVRQANASGCAAGLVYEPPEKFSEAEGEVRIAFDADSVLFSAESEKYYKEHGLPDYLQHEADNADTPLSAGPFKAFLQSVASIQEKFNANDCPIRTAVVTARNAPAHERAIRTLRAWNIRVNEMHFLGGVSKNGVLRAFQPHIFFDDQAVHLERCADEIPAAQVCADVEGH